MENLSVISNYLKSHAGEITVSVLFLVVGWTFINLFTGFIRKKALSNKVDPSLAPFISTFIQVGLKIVLLVTMASQLGVKTTSLVALLGTIGLAIGMALKDTLGHFASGVVLLWHRPFSVGDFIEGAGTSGIVKEIQLFSTILTTPDNKTILIPNGQLLNGNVVNYSLEEKRRVDFVFGIAYSDDFEKAKTLIANYLGDDKRVVEEPFVRVSSLSASSVDITVRAWVEKANYWDVYFDTLEGIKKVFDREGINFPFPQQELWLRNP